MRFLKITSIIALLFAVVGHAHAKDKIDAPEIQPLAPLKGSFVIAGGGKLSDGVFQAFVRLAGGSNAKLAVIEGKGGKHDSRWDDLDVASVEVVKLTTSRGVTNEKTLATLFNATGIWLVGDFAKLYDSEVLESILTGVVARGGVVGGTADGASALTQVQQGRKTAGFDVLPQSVIVADYDANDEDDLIATLDDNPGCVGWGIPKGTALVVHSGRRVCAVGEGVITAVIAPRNDWEGRSQNLETALFIQRWDELPYDLDFLAWTRSAQLRTQPAFPPKVAPTPELEKGTLVINGGRRVTDEAFDRFIKAAGGKDAKFVCIPSGLSQPEDDFESYSADNLRDRDCEHVTVLHTHIRDKANDKAFTESLANADGVWIDGGRTYRLMDAIQHTRAHRLIRDVLKRGGVVGGSSAGAQVVGDFLMRGRPSTNAALWWDGYQTGLGLLQGVIIDAHFRQRGRQNTFPEVMNTFPQMLGIGIDEDTTLVITGTTAEIIGDNEVTFYDYRNDKKIEHVLDAGRKYDLKNRKPLDK